MASRLGSLHASLAPNQAEVSAVLKQSFPDTSLPVDEQLKQAVNVIKHHLHIIFDQKVENDTLRKVKFA
ncbi:unnamed protein product [Protopolystoma xenopodis]|uniref:Uncharacterized protein n=1 Tax=Protopolystoma xenopodis TaxID=117903 RepID=A0A448WW55_9PLAT|nr:unnamed protein product [Protopolystoma xenopodis]